MRRLLTLCAGAASTLCFALTGAAQQSAAGKLAWMRDYAIPYTTAASSPVQPRVHAQMNLATRFVPTVHVFLPQHQWIWRDGNQFTPLPQMAREFLGVPGRAWDLGASAWIDENRFVTETGCVPHDCGPTGSNGLLWADTSQQRPWLIFAASTLATVQHGPAMRLWLFSSRKLDFQKAPADLLLNLQRWMQAQDAPRASDYLLVTIVQPSGEQVDLDLASLKAAASAKDDQ